MTLSVQPSPGRRFRELLAAGPVTVPGVFNAITAQLAVQAGFDALYLSGAGVTNSLTGYPDIALITLTEMAEQARYVSRAAGVPVIADADTGYGDVHNVMRAVETLEQAGLAGIHIEDQLSPKRCGHLDGKQVIAPDEMARKIVAARRARRDPDFFLIARTDARGVNGLQDAIDRALVYLDAGADAIFPEGLQSAEEFAEVAKRVPGPLLANMTEFGKSPYLSVEELDNMGYRIVIFPMMAFRVMMAAARSAYAELKASGTQKALLDKMMTRAELYELIRYTEYEELDKELAEECNP